MLVSSISPMICIAALFTTPHKPVRGMCTDIGDRTLLAVIFPMLVNARNEVGARLCFYTSVIVFGGGGVVSQHASQVVSQHALQQLSRGRVVSKHALQVSRPTPRGEVQGSGQGGLQAHTWGGPGPHPRGVSRPTPRGCLQAHTWGGVSQHALRQTPPSRRLLLRAVRILLECILVSIFLFSCDYIVIPVLGAYFVTY